MKTQLQLRALDLLEIYAANNRDSYQMLVECRKALQSGDGKTARVYARKAYRKARMYLWRHHHKSEPEVCQAAKDVWQQAIDGFIRGEQSEVDLGNFV